MKCPLFHALWLAAAAAAAPGDESVIGECGSADAVFDVAAGHIQSALDGRCLGAECPDDPTGAKCYPLRFGPCSTTPVWEMDGLGRFLSLAHNSSACLDLASGGVGPAVGLYRCDGLPSQRWTLGVIKASYSTGSVDSPRAAQTVKTVALPAKGPRCLTNGFVAPPTPPPTVPNKGPFALDRAGLDQEFYGLGAISGGGATTRLLLDYPEEQQSQILDLLFKPGFGASLQMLKVEIGGDCLSTDGSESSHMHDNATVNLHAGYEWWLMVEAKKRNPDIKLYGLPWAYPGWVGNDPVTGTMNESATPFDHPEQTTRYMLEWVKGAKSEYGLDIDYLGIWNESPSDPTYVKMLRRALDAGGFGTTTIVAADGGADICTKLAADPEYDKAVGIIGLHYPSDYYDLSACHALGKPVWASEESSSYDDLNGAACWARVTNSHYVMSGITSSIMWNLLGSYYPGTSWYASSMLTADQPWSGWYGVRGRAGTAPQLPVVWATAHLTQFTKVGWRYLKNGLGSGGLERGGFYTTIADPNGADFTVNIVKIDSDHAPCTRPGLPAEVVEPENATFVLAPSMGKGITSLTCWRSNLQPEHALLFEQQPDIPVVDGRFTLPVNLGDYITVSTIRGAANHGSFSTPVPPAQPRSPIPVVDNFDTTPLSQQPRLWSQMTGSFETQTDPANASNVVLRQMSTQVSVDNWRGRFNMMPATVVGMREWQDVSISTRFRLPAGPASGTVYPGTPWPPANPNACVGTRNDWTMSAGVVLCVSGSGQWNFTYGGGAQYVQPIVSGRLSVAPAAGEWHVLNLTTEGTSASATVDGTSLFTNLAIRDIDSGFASLGTSGFFATDFDDVAVVPVGPNWDPNPTPPAGCLPSVVAAGDGGGRHGPSLVGHMLSTRGCQSNGIAAPDQNWYLLPDWRVQHAASSLCAEAASAAAGSTVSLQACNASNPLQLWKNDYSNIHHGSVPLTLEGPGMVLVGGLDGDVRTRPAAWKSPGDWTTWTFFDSTGQLRSQRTPRGPIPAKCLALCTDP